MKMRRIVATLVMLAMMLVYLPMQTTAEAQSETLLPKTMEQLQSISVDSDGVIVFSTMEDFELIISEADKNFEKLISASTKTHLPLKYLCFCTKSNQFFTKDDFNPSFTQIIT